METHQPAPWRVGVTAWWVTCAAASSPTCFFFFFFCASEKLERPNVFWRGRPLVTCTRVFRTVFPLSRLYARPFESDDPNFFHFTCSRQMTATRSRFLLLCFCFLNGQTSLLFLSLLCKTAVCSQLSSLSPSLCIIMFFPAVVFWEETLQLHASQNCCRPPQSFSHSSSLNLLSLLLLLLSCAPLFVPSLQPSDWCWHIPLKMWKILNWRGERINTIRCAPRCYSERNTVVLKITGEYYCACRRTKWWLAENNTGYMLLDKPQVYNLQFLSKNMSSTALN